ncbi:MAG: redox-regulated ATPase YchF [Lentisphaeraceae bacterium]|nr:redox-regulated ATPase YchF [Lentisphaeraceae bacterium]
MAGLSCGIVGLPNVGKSTLFNAITKAGAEAANYPFCTIDPNVGVVTVPDARVERLVELVQPKNTQYATIEFVDIAGLVRGASKGEGRGNQFLDNIHHVDAIVHVVRCFQNDNVVHVDGKVDPVSDIDTINLELILADLDRCEKIIERLAKKAKGNDANAKKSVEVIKKMAAHLETNLSLRVLELTDEERDTVAEYKFLTDKPIIYVANVGEDDLPDMDNDMVQKVRDFAKTESAEVVPVCAAIEEEIAQLDGDEASEFLESLGLNESGLDRLIKRSYETLGLITYLTAGEVEVRAWTIREGWTAPQAASVIHSDFEKLFIRAEVKNFADFDRLGSEKAVKEAGLMRVEGKEYIVKDGDIMLFLNGK